MIRPLVLALACGSTALVQAQTSPYLFEVDPAQSNWTWAATANGLPVTPTSTDQFQMFGTFDATLGLNAGGFVAEGSIDGGEVTIAPDVEGTVAFFFHIKVEDLLLSPEALTMDFGSPPASDGTFTTDIVWHVIQGTATVTPLFGSPDVIDLAGTSTAPAFVTGAFTTNPDGTLHLVLPHAMQLDLEDPDSGNQFIVDLVGTLTADEVRFTTTYCFGDGSGTACPCGNAGAADEGCANGTGAGAQLEASGSNSIAGGDLVLSGSQMVPSTPGIYFQGNNQVNGGLGILWGDGLRCAGGGLRRLQVRVADGLGSSATTVDIAAGGLVNPGETKFYQIFYRDPSTSPCGEQFNTTHGLGITWAP